ncbi:MAG: ATP-binding protein [Bacteroidetes bacterium]|nr:ATP-binding protein [Bacteroidota bacterium]
MIDNIPQEILRTDHFPEDVSILIGENGSGKSTLLNNLSKHFLARGKDVIAIANSIHDKFDAGHRHFKTLRGRSGRRQARSTIKNALQNIAESEIQRLKNASQALKYVDFDPVIGFKIEGLSESFRNKIANSNFNADDREKVSFLLEKMLRESTAIDDIVWLEIDSFSFSELEKSALTELILWEGRLKDLQVISRIEVFLRKKNVAISMLDASSGELVLITSIVYLSTVITEKTVILIDEPENSLHPKWQKEYAKIILDIFYRYQPKIIIATHSPLVINGAELFIENPHIYKSENFTFELQKKEPLNLEEIFFRFFDITTPQNRFMSDRIVRLLNLLANKKILLSAFENELFKISTNSYDPKQIEVLNTVKELANEISAQSQIG